MGMNSTRRKLAIATWDGPREGNIHGKVVVDTEELHAFVDHLRATTDERVSITHVVGKACADAIARHPSMNGRILFGKFVPFDTIDIGYLVVLEGGADLSLVKIERANEKSVLEIAAELRERATKLREGKDEDFKQTQSTIKRIPMFLLRRMVRIIGWLASVWGADIPAMGVKKFPFGSCMITSVGMFGLDEAYAPFTPFAHVPLLVLVGASKPRAVVVDGEIVVRRQLSLTATLDHRFVDGMEGARMTMACRDILQRPVAPHRA